VRAIYHAQFIMGNAVCRLAQSASFVVTSTLRRPADAFAQRLACIDQTAAQKLLNVPAPHWPLHDG
jgi:hypothetical protein